MFTLRRLRESTGDGGLAEGAFGPQDGQYHHPCSYLYLPEHMRWTYE